MTVRAIFENGVFKPSTAVSLPEHAEVELEIASVNAAHDPERREAIRRVHDVLALRFDDPELPPDLAARHNEHQP